MTFQFRCPNSACRKRLSVSEHHAGKRGKCPACGAALTVPREEPARGAATATGERQPAAPPCPSEMAARESSFSARLGECRNVVGELQARFARLCTDVAGLSEQTGRLDSEMRRLAQRWEVQAQQAEAHRTAFDQRLADLRGRLERLGDSDSSQFETLIAQVAQLDQRGEQTARAAESLRVDLDAIGQQSMEREALEEAASRALRRQLDEAQGREERLVRAVRDLQERLRVSVEEETGLLEERSEIPQRSGQAAQQAGTSAAREASDSRRFDVTIHGVPQHDLPKRRAVLAVVKHLCAAGQSPEQIAAAVPWRSHLFSSVERVVDAREFIALMQQQERALGKRFDAKRYFCKDDELLVHDGKTYALSNQWRSRTHETIDKLLEAFPESGVSCSPSA